MEMENSLTTGQNKSTEEPEILWMARKIVNGTVPSWSVSDKAIRYRIDWTLQGRSLGRTRMASHGMIHRKFDKIKIATLSCWAKAWKIASKNE